MRVEELIEEIKNNNSQICTIGTFGLCDRVNLFKKAHQVSQLTGKTINYYWQNNHALNCSFHKLFKTDIFKISTEKPSKEHYEIKRFVGFDFDNFDQYFSPSEIIQNYIDKYKEDNWQEKTLGVHVRIGDKVDWHIPVEKYFEEIEKLSINNYKLFVCSDSNEVLIQFKNRYGHRVLIYPTRTFNRNSEEGMIDSTTCLYLLRDTKGVIGWDGSGYSLLAGWDNGFNSVPSKFGYSDLNCRKIKRPKIVLV